ncbi:MAG: hydroxymethylbilane synthase [Candidatus Neomarinimicrobiota bacterium]
MPHITDYPQKIRLGTRGSALALWQAEDVKATLLTKYADLSVEIQVIKTSGDKDLATPLDTLPFSGYFTKELEAALMEGTADIAVHSLKDMAARTIDPFKLAAVLPRGPAEDALVLNPKYKTVNDLPQDPFILTGSIRRQRQLARLFPGCRTGHVRGNIKTRIRKLSEQNADALVVAKAALIRLGIEDQKVITFSVDQMIPAPAQGAIGIECLTKRKSLLALLHTIEDKITRTAVDIERQITALLEGGCSLPLGVHVSPRDAGLLLTVGFFPKDPQGVQIIQETIHSTDDIPAVIAALTGRFHLK